MKRSLRTTLVLTIAIIAALAFSATSALGATRADSFNIGFVSSGDAGAWFGNLGTPIRWYNQDVSIVATPTLYAFESTSTITLSYLGYSYNGSEFTSITAETTHTVFATEGLYSFDATGSNTAEVTYEGTRTIGIDKTRPATRSNLVPVYNGSALVTITVTDALSGPEYILYTLDGAPAYAVPGIGGGLIFDSLATALAVPAPPAGNSYDIGVNVAGRGLHTLSWFAVDNAGNHGGWHSTTFRINAPGYTPVLGRPSVSVLRHRVSFKGTVTAATRAKQVILTVQRKDGSSWDSYAKFTVLVAKYAGSYWIRETISDRGKYRVKAAEANGKSRWSKEFRVR
jgi:hypothetical protein